MISAIIFSRDRPAQLDLLLASLDRNAPSVFSPVTVIFHASDYDYAHGYVTCRREHPGVRFVEENEFRQDFFHVLDLVDTPLVTTFCDDDVLYRPMPAFSIRGSTVRLCEAEDVLCFSLRLGFNTGNCYPLRRMQGLPAFVSRYDVYGQLLAWPWRNGDGDYSYAGSLDGHVWRIDDLRALIGDRPFTNPNELEDALVQGCTLAPFATMACYPQSVLVGIPANRVNETHLGNRYGEEHFESERSLNSRYLEGKRLDLDAIRADKVTGAHTELELKWRTP